MPALLLRGAPVARTIRDQTSATAAVLREQAGVVPLLATVLAGGDPAALAYRASISRSVSRAGIDHRPIDVPGDASPAAFLRTLRALDDDRAVHGVLLLMPLPPQIPVELAIEHLSPMKDVDGITPTNAGRLHLGLPALRPSTPQGGIELLDHYGVAIARTRAVVIGRSNVVGKPLAALLTARNATVTLCHRQTPDLPAILAGADIVAVAAGAPGLVRGDQLSPHAVVLDFGINVRADGSVVGDADEVSLVDRVAAYSPVPGGAGPVTTMVLARNTVAAAFASLGAEVEGADLPDSTPTAVESVESFAQ